eukprot:9477769-Pyramimonas_sp.AAC.1
MPLRWLVLFSPASGAPGQSQTGGLSILSARAGGPGREAQSQAGRAARQEKAGTCLLEPLAARGAAVADA